MKIDISVKDRMLTNMGTYRIPSGSLNDVYIAFHFEPGYGWEDMSITAEFRRTNQTVYLVNVKPDAYQAIPANVLMRPGVIYVGLIGCKNGEQVATTLTTTLTVEHNASETMRPCIYPEDADNNPDNDAYAAWCQVVVDAANRAEVAAEKAESIAMGSYTKDESDARYAKKIDLVATATDEFDASYMTTGTYPTITVNALPPEDTAGSVGDLAGLHSITGVKMRVTSENSSYDASYSGFTLRWLADNDLFDKLIINKDGAYVKQKIYALKVGSVPGKWLTETQYAVSIITSPEIDLTYADNIVTNAGIKPVGVSLSTITLELPPGTTAEQLMDIEIWYPMLGDSKILVSAMGTPTVDNKEAKILMFKTVNEKETPLSSFGVQAELDVSKYLSGSIAETKTLIEELEALKEEVEAWPKTNNIRIENFEVANWEIGEGAVTLNINIKGARVLNVYGVGLEEGEYAPVSDYLFTTTETGITLKVASEAGLDGYVVLYVPAEA